MGKLLIREIQPADAEKLIMFSKQVGGETDNLTFGADGFPITVEQEIARLQAMADDPKTIMYSAWREDELIATGSIHSMPRRMAHRAELGLTVIKEEWNKGIGSLLLEQIIQFAKGIGIEIINLEVRSDNAAAIHLYEKFGFQRIGTSPAYFKIDNSYYDFEIMYLDLREKPIQSGEVV